MIQCDSINIYIVKHYILTDKMLRAAISQFYLYYNENTDINTNMLLFCDQTSGSMCLNKEGPGHLQSKGPTLNN